ncbi:MAG: hypothetical protein E7256_17900 [Lachnospiraceae bacterium]|nr:hypothetical protein [Lachnospiraceae bacterium]
MTGIKVADQIIRYGFLAAQAEERIVHPLYGLLTWVLMLGGLGTMVIGIGYLCGVVNETEVLEKRKIDPNITSAKIRRQKRVKGAWMAAVGLICVIIQNFM